MLGWIAELLPLFFVRWVALRHCERLRLAGAVDVVMARPDVLVKLPQKKQPEASRRPGCKKLTGCVCERENLGDQCIWRL